MTIFVKNCQKRESLTVFCIIQRSLGIVFTNGNTNKIIKSIKNAIADKKTGSELSYYKPNYEAINRYHIKVLSGKLNDLLLGLVCHKNDLYR
jgi:hypothetical protein